MQTNKKILYSVPNAHEVSYHIMYQPQYLNKKRFASVIDYIGSTVFEQRKF